MRKYSLRKFINDLHLWLGIGSGIILFLVCLSGSFLVYEHEIKAFFAEDVAIHATAEKKSITKLNALAVDQIKGELLRLTIPADQSQVYEYRVKTSPKDRRGTIFLADPYKGTIIKAPESSASGFMSFMFRLHRWLLLDTSIGRPIVGVATVIFIILAISGIVLWFPKKLKWKTLKQGLKIKTNANWKRINHDLHNTLGFYASIFLLIMAITGLCWSFESYRNGLSSVLGAKVFGNRGGSPSYRVTSGNLDTISYDQALKLAKNIYPNQGKKVIYFPSGNAKHFHIQQYGNSSWSSTSYKKVVFDIYGNILDKEDFSQKPLNQKIAATIRPLHTGEIFGFYSKIIYFLGCLIATSLPITGTLIWINKLKKKKQQPKDVLQ